jgi:hypothetical protein
MSSCRPVKTPKTRVMAATAFQSVDHKLVEETGDSPNSTVPPTALRNMIEVELVFKGGVYGPNALLIFRRGPSHHDRS